MAKRVTSRDLRGTTIAGKPVTRAQYQRGDLLKALMPGIKGTKIAGKPLTPQGYLRGDLAKALFPGMNTATGTPLAPTPAAPAAPGPAPLPPDATYDAQRGAADLQYGTTMGGLAGGRARGLSDYGYQEANIDPATGVGSLTFDPNNPFSKAALLKQNYDRTRRSSAQSMGSTGQLYSGAFQNQQDLVNRGELGAQDTLQKSLGDFLARNTTAAGQAGVDKATAYSRAAEAAQGRIDTNPLYDPAATVATPAAAAANTRGAVVTNKLGHRGRWVTRPDGTRYFQVV